ncbi:hypothetical protein OBBRIDRAFT_418121 [Obba rivulosa]|uniref:Uncharacterized protein n=1 Tax=Obba rivulosa TaxID=1052685 RepID=A0A8E2B5V4_9APHY|nr:hypothetical protein OBBRIDRAFT_418121 [Obba rivulosa]
MSSAVLTTLLSLLSLQYIIHVSSVPHNVTIDDTNVDVFTNRSFTYTPASSWDAGSWDAADSWVPGGGCDGCLPDFDPTIPIDSTWHSSTFAPSTSSGYPNATVTFRGTALYVYCIVTAAFGNSDMTFYLDGQPKGSYTYDFVAESDPEYHYSVPVIQLETLSDEEHTFTLLNGQATGEGQMSLVILDRIKYTTELTEDADPSSSSSSSGIARSTNTSSSNSHSKAAPLKTIVIALAAAAGVFFV